MKGMLINKYQLCVRTSKDMKGLLICKYQKTVVSVYLLCSKCRKVMKLISSIEGVNSILLDPSKNTATVIGKLIQ